MYLIFQVKAKSKIGKKRTFVSHVVVEGEAMSDDRFIIFYLPFLRLFMDIVFFSDFVETAPPRHKAAKKASPPPPQFPLPARPISEMNRNQVGSYAKQLVDFICLPNRKRGQGRCLPWEKQVSAGLISLKNRNMLKLTNNDVVSLAMIREWSSMGFSGGFKQGPGKSDQFWLKTISWSSFLLVIVEILMAVFEKGTVGEQSTSRSQETSPSSRPCSTSGASCPPSSFPLCPPQYRPARLPSSRPPCPPSTRQPRSPSLPAVQTGCGPLTKCLGEWLVYHPDKTLSSLPLDVSHPPRLRVC